jgi:hypothetical protein
LAIGLWWGSLTAVFIFVPILFAQIPTRTVAGNAAAHLFAAQTWISVLCGLFLLMNLRPRDGAQPSGGIQHVALFCTLAGMLLALLVQYGIAPHIAARENLAFWHPLGSAMLVIEWVCALILMWRLPWTLRGA